MKQNQINHEPKNPPQSKQTTQKKPTNQPTFLVSNLLATTF